MKKLVIIRGVPGTGKSTLASKQYGEYEHLEADMYFINGEGEYVFKADHIHEAHNWCQNWTKRLMLREEPGIVISNTFTTFREMKYYIDLAKSYGYEIEVISLTHEYGSIHGVPEETMQKMRNRFASHDQIMGKVNDEH